MKAHAAMIVSVLTLGLYGCASNISVVKATADTPGLHYFLPQPFVQVTPKPDGTMNVEVIYLPDPDNEYAIQTSSYFGHYTIDVNRSEKGFLGTVSFNADSTGVVKQLIQSATNLRAAQLDAKAAKATADAADAKAAREKVTAAVDAADKARTDAQVEVYIAKQKLDLLIAAAAGKNPPANIDEQILAAKLALAEAVVKRDAASVAYNAALANPAAANARAVKRPTSPEPVFLRVAMLPGTVKLVRDFDQSDRETWLVPKTNAPASDLTVLPASMVVRPAQNNALTATVKADRELLDALFAAVNPPLKGTTRDILFSLKADKNTVDIEFPNDTAAGDYLVDGKFTTGTKDTNETVTKNFKIRIER